jgi:GTP-binding protein Era
MTDNPAPPAGATGESSSVATRCGFIALIGAPNAGKSTLTNHLVGAKVTIVSRKVQTTRTPVRGIAIVGNSQLVFIDTPGIFRPKRRLDRAMVDAAWGRAGEADVVALLVDAAKGIDEDVGRILEKSEGLGRRRILVLNKVDRIQEKEKLLALIDEVSRKASFERVFLISALSGSGVEDLKQYLASAVPEGPWHYPEDDITDLPLRLLASEITREKIFDRLHQELPYAATVETTAWQERKDGSVRIEQTIFVERDSQRQIVLGRGGETIKRISMESRKELAEIVERPVHLFLYVKVREGWENDPERYREMGLDFPKE